MKGKWIAAVGVYSESGHRTDTVNFKYWWQAYLFHVLLNQSTSHNGTREY